MLAAMTSSAPSPEERTAEMQHALVDARLPGGDRPQRVLQALRAAALRAPAGLLAIVLKALVTALWAHRRYHQLRSKGIAHETAIRQVLLSEPRD
jgi:hypothetical protein